MTQPVRCKTCSFFVPKKIDDKACLYLEDDEECKNPLVLNLSLSQSDEKEEEKPEEEE